MSLWQSYSDQRTDLTLVSFIESVKNLAVDYEKFGLGMSVADGLPGVAAFLHSYGILFSDANILNVSRECYIKACSILELDGNLSYFGGPAGAADILIGIAEPLMRPSCLELLDKRLISIVDSTDLSLEWVNGLSGLGNYAHVRFIENPDLARRIAHVVSTKFPSKITDVHQNMGIAHGIPGTLLFLSDHFLMTEDPSLPPTIRSIVSMIRHGRTSPGDSTYSYTVGGIVPARLGWCYGDLSVALALIRASHALDDHDIRREALILIERAASRSIRSAFVTDATFCHGSLGLAHLFHRCALWTKSFAAKRAAKFWLSHFCDVQASSFTDHFDGVGLLEGLTGGGLVAMAALSEQAPLWDRVFLGQADLQPS